MRVLALYKGDCQPAIGARRQREGPRNSDSAAGNSRNDADGDPVGDLGAQTVEVTHIVIIDEDIHELAQPAVLVEETIGETRMRRLKTGDHFRERARSDLHLLRSPRKRTEGGGDANRDCHGPKSNRISRNYEPELARSRPP